MQIETLQNVAGGEVKSYLRVATISSKTALCYFYIGTRQCSLKLLEDNFKSGFSVSDLETAKKVLSLEENHLVDAIILDIPYDEKNLKAFYYFLKNRSLDNIPVIYNDHYLNSTVLPQHVDLIDDVIDLSNWQFDFYNKITFLKKSKSYITNNKKRQKEDEQKSVVVKRVIDIVLASVLILLL
ncbi:MAG: hypothetical protein ACXVBX_04670, partial [Flavisolibacter sp.]